MPQDHEPLPIKNVSVQEGQPTPPGQNVSGAIDPNGGFAVATAAKPPVQQPHPGTTTTFEFMSGGKHYKAVIGSGGPQGYSIQMYRNANGNWKASDSRFARPILAAFIVNDVFAAINSDQYEMKKS